MKCQIERPSKQRLIPRVSNFMGSGVHIIRNSMLLKRCHFLFLSISTSQCPHLQYMKNCFSGQPHHTLLYCSCYCTVRFSFLMIQFSYVSITQKYAYTYGAYIYIYIYLYIFIHKNVSYNHICFAGEITLWFRRRNQCLITCHLARYSLGAPVINMV